MRAREAFDLAVLTVEYRCRVNCLAAANLAAKRQDLRSVSTGGKIERSICDQCPRMRRSLATNTKSEDVSLQTHSLGSSRNRVKMVTRVAWGNLA